MTKKEINELKSLLTLEECRIRKLCGCYVDGARSKVTRINETFLNLPEEEQHKYFEIFRKNYSGTQGKNLLDMSFSEEAKSPEGTREFLDNLIHTELSDEDLLEEFYDRIIDSFTYTGHYLILLNLQVYDVPNVTSDNILMEDASDEVYSFINFCICPVNMSEPGLGYDEAENTFHNQERGYMVKLPELGFLYPAFNDRSEDCDSVLLYTKSADSFYDNFIKCILDCHIPMPATEQRETFQNLIVETLEDDCDYEVVKNIHENLNKAIEDKKEGSAPVTLDKEEIHHIFEKSGVAEEKLVLLDDRFEKHFEAEPEQEKRFVSSNVVPAKKLELKTADVVVKFDADKTDLVETREIDGVNCLVIKIEEGLWVNGIPIRTS